MKTEPIRIIVEVKLIASARKLVTVRSALQIISKISMPVEILCQAIRCNPDSLDSEDGTPIDGRIIGRLEPNSTFFVDIAETNSELRIRPCEGYTFYSTESIKWWTSQTTQCQILNCSGQPSDNSVAYHASKAFFTRLERLDFPSGPELKSEIDELERRASEQRIGPSKKRESVNLNMAMPGHNCYIYPAITIKNLLPLDLGYWLVGQDGIISSHQSKEIFYHPNIINLRLKLEGFNTSDDIPLPRDRQETTTAIITDLNGRSTLLTVKLQVDPCIVISISAKYWLVNHTSLPLVFRQKECETAAGQFEDHEEARCRMPLLFAYTDFEVRFFFEGIQMG